MKNPNEVENGMLDDLYWDDADERIDRFEAECRKADEQEDDDDHDGN